MADEIKNVHELDTTALSGDNEFAGEEPAPVATEEPATAERPKEEELSPESFVSDSYIQNPDVGESIILDVKKIVSNPQIEGTNKTTGEKFHIGVKRKDGVVIRRDVITDEGRYSIKNWEIFYKLFGKEGIVSIYAKEHGKFEGLKIKIKKCWNGGHAMRDAKELMKLMDLDTIEKAEEYKKSVADAMKANKLYEVTLVTE